MVLVECLFVCRNGERRTAYGRIQGLELGSGSILELDMAGRLGTIRFCPLAEPEVFRSVTTDGQKLRFGKALEITASEVMDLAMIPPPRYTGGSEADG